MNTAFITSKHHEMKALLDLKSTTTITSLPFSKHDEAKRLLEKLETRKKIRLLSGASVWTTKAIPQLGIPTVWLCDGPHGLRKQKEEWVTNVCSGNVKATCFPTASCLACSWDVELLNQVGEALGRECCNQDVPIVLLGPGINLIRHPCGGRSFEYFSEDPILTGHLASSLIQGVQSQGVGTSLKHFFSNNQEKWRMTHNVVVDERTQRELYLRSFQYVIQTAQPWIIMTAYNKVNGEYCGEHSIVDKVVRGEWGFQGLVVTDWGGTSDRVQAIRNGIDLEMPGSVGAFDDQILMALRNGDLSEDKLNACAVRILSLLLACKYQRCISNDNDVSPETQINHGDAEEGNDRINHHAHHNLARIAALQSIVLLKNEGGLLPLNNCNIEKVAIIGAFAKEPRFQGGGSSEVNPHKVDCAWDRIQEYTTEAHYAPGYNNNYEENEEVDSIIEEAAALARSCSKAIIFCGLPEIAESEAFDRDDMDLPESHNALIYAVVDANPNTVVVLSNGSVVALPWIDKVPAVLETWLCGQAGASATVDLLFGRASPAGKLAQTFPLSRSDIPSDAYFPGSKSQVEYREGLNVGYRYYNTYDRDVMFPFGHGLSYTQFTYRNLGIKTEAGSYDVMVEFELQNTGSRSGAEIVQCYVHDCHSTVYRPHHELKAFKKVLLKPNELKKVVLSLSKDAFAFWDIGAHNWIVEPGDFEVQIGSSSRDIHLKHIINFASGKESSTEARLSHTPTEISPYIDDARFQAMVSCIPQNRIVPDQKLNENSSLGESSHSIIGRLFIRIIKSAMLSNIENPRKNDEKFSNEMAKNVPLRGIVIFSRGWLTFPVLTLLLHIMNGNWLQVLWKTPFTFVHYLLHIFFFRFFKNKV